MLCPKCHRDNPETAQFCIRCHATLRFICPACKHVQDRGGKCDQCGVDFAKYTAMLIFQAKDTAEQQRARTKQRASIIKQILLFPITGGLSLLRYFSGRLRGD